MPSLPLAQRRRTIGGRHLRSGLLALIALLPGVAAAASPDFSGSWTLDRTRSDDLKARIDEAAGPAQVEGGGTSPLTILPKSGTRATVERVEMRDWLLGIAAQVDHLEVEQSASEIKLFHGEELARTFYFGRESFRQDGQGHKLKCRTTWKGSELVLSEEGEGKRRILETLSVDPAAGTLVETVRFEDRLMKKPLEVRLLYTRAAGPAR